MPESLLTIVFRGMIVVNLRSTDDGDYCEFGILHTADGHYVRINTVKNCVLESVQPIKDDVILALSPDWQLEVINPVENGVTTRTEGEEFNRREHPFGDDFRWLIDLEGVEFYDSDLTDQIHTDVLRPVIRVPCGQLYTRLKSRELDRSRGTGAFENFGFISAAIGCDIRVNENTRVILKATGVTLPDFTFEFDQREPHTIYEIVNSPPDVSEVEHHHTGDLDENGLTEAQMADHFQHYYDMFNDPDIERFQFEESGAAPGPRPALCGLVQLGTRNVDFHSDVE